MVHPVGRGCGPFRGRRAAALHHLRHGLHLAARGAGRASAAYRARSLRLHRLAARRLPVRGGRLVLEPVRHRDRHRAHRVRALRPQPALPAAADVDRAGRRGGRPHPDVRRLPQGDIRSRAGAARGAGRRYDGPGAAARPPRQQGAGPLLAPQSHRPGVDRGRAGGDGPAGGRARRRGRQRRDSRRLRTSRFRVGRAAPSAVGPVRDRPLGADHLSHQGLQLPRAERFVRDHRQPGRPCGVSAPDADGRGARLARGAVADRAHSGVPRGRALAGRARHLCGGESADGRRAAWFRVPGARLAAAPGRLSRLDRPAAARRRRRGAATGADRAGEGRDHAGYDIRLRRLRTVQRRLSPGQGGAGCGRPDPCPPPAGLRRPARG